MNNSTVQTQYVSLEFGRDAVQLYLLKSVRRITLARAVKWAKKNHGFDEERDSLTFSDPPTVARLENRACLL